MKGVEFGLDWLGWHKSLIYWVIGFQLGLILLILMDFDQRTCMYRFIDSIIGNII